MTAFLSLWCALVEGIRLYGLSATAPEAVSLWREVGEDRGRSVDVDRLTVAGLQPSPLFLYFEVVHDGVDLVHGRLSESAAQRGESHL